MDEPIGIAFSPFTGRHERARELKAKGRKIMGYLCAYCPEEIFYAAGITPIRVFGGKGPYDEARPNLPEYYCAHARGCLNAGLTGEYDYLDGLIYPNACLHTKGAYDSWARRFPSSRTWFLDMPSVVHTPEALDFFVQELQALCRHLEDAFGVAITDERLEGAIRFCNEERARLRAIYLKKVEERPAISGGEAFSWILKSMTGGKGNPDLQGFLAGIETRERPGPKGARVLVIGTELHDPRIFAAIEEQGAVIVADTLCTGARYIWNDVETWGNPLEAIARHYLLGVNCPLKHPLDRGLELIRELVDRFGVEKALFLWPRACDPMGWAVPFIRKILDDRRIPHLWASIEGEGGEDDLLEAAKAAKALLGR